MHASLVGRGLIAISGNLVIRRLFAVLARDCGTLFEDLDPLQTLKAFFYCIREMISHSFVRYTGASLSRTISIPRRLDA